MAFKWPKTTICINEFGTFVLSSFNILGFFMVVIHIYVGGTYLKSFYPKQKKKSKFWPWWPFKGNNSVMATDIFGQTTHIMYLRCPATRKNGWQIISWGGSGGPRHFPDYRSCFCFLICAKAFWRLLSPFFSTGAFFSLSLHPNSAQAVS